MATMIVTLRVANFEKWKAVFDSMETHRLEYGWTAGSVHRDAADANIVVTISRFRSVDDARRWATSQELRDAMSRAGVQGQPEVQFLEDVP
jgi:hypothetical protein